MEEGRREREGGNERKENRMRDRRRVKRRNNAVKGSDVRATRAIGNVKETT